MDVLENASVPGLVARSLIRVHVGLAILLVAASATLYGWRIMDPPSPSYGLDALVASGDPAYARFQQFSRLFASNEIGLLVVQFPRSAITPEHLAMIEQVHAELAALPGGPLVSSVARLADSSDRAALARAALLGGAVPTVAERLARDPGAAAAVAGELLNNSAAVGRLISRDGRTAALVVQLRDPGELGQSRPQIVAGMRRIHHQLRMQQPELTSVLGGPLVTMMELQDTFSADFQLFGRLVMAMSAGMLLLIFRRVGWTLVSLAVAAVSVGLVQGIGYLFSIPLGISGMMIVTLTTITAIATCVQLIVNYHEQLEPMGGDARLATLEQRRRALRQMLAFKIKPTFIVACTTLLGFLALAVSDVLPIRQFAQLTAVGVFIGWLAAVVLITWAMYRLPPLAPIPPPQPHRLGVAGGLDVVTRFAQRRPALAAMVLLSAAAVLLLGTRALRQQTTFMENFRPSSDTYQAYRFIEQNLTSLGPIETVLTAGAGEPILRPDVLGAMKAFESAAMARHPGVLSPPLSVRVLLDEVPGAGLLTSPRAIELAVRTVESFGGRAAVRNVFSRPDPATTRPAGDERERLRINFMATEGLPTPEKLRVVADLAALADQYFTPVNVQAEVTGLYALYAQLLTRLIDTQAESFAVAVATIFATVLIGFWSWRLAVVALVPNLASVLMSLGLMGWLSIPISTSSLMVLSIAIGIAVDTTVYYLYRYRHERLAGRSRAEAMLLANHHAGRASVFSQGIIIGGFWILVFSSFLPTASFGLLLALALLAGSAAHFLAMPMLLRLMRL